MKKFLLCIFSFCLLVLGAFSFVGCGGVKNYDGYYKLYMVVDSSDARFSYYATELDYEIYVKISGGVATRYTLEPSENQTKKLVKDPEEFLINKKVNFFDEEVLDDGTVLYVEYTDLTGDYTENPYKINMKKYVKVNNLPLF